MSELIAFVLIFLGVITSPTEVTDSMVSEYQTAIERTLEDPAFQEYYQESAVDGETIGNVDTWEGD